LKKPAEAIAQFMKKCSEMPPEGKKTAEYLTEVLAAWQAILAEFKICPLRGHRPIHALIGKGLVDLPCLHEDCALYVNDTCGLTRR